MRGGRAVIVACAVLAWPVVGGWAPPHPDPVVELARWSNDQPSRWERIKIWEEVRREHGKRIHYGWTESLVLVSPRPVREGDWVWFWSRWEKGDMKPRKPYDAKARLVFDRYESMAHYQCRTRVGNRVVSRELLDRTWPRDPAERPEEIRNVDKQFSPQHDRDEFAAGAYVCKHY